MRRLRSHRSLFRMLLMLVWLHAPSDIDIADSIKDALERVRRYHHHQQHH